jgi:rod shape-determining protein MreC
MTLTIDRGERDQLRRGMAVLAPQGVVGQIAEVSHAAARVVLVTDHNSGIDGLVQRTRARGIVEGTVSEACGLKFVKRTEDLQPGDVIVSVNQEPVTTPKEAVAKLKAAQSSTDKSVLLQINRHGVNAFVAWSSDQSDNG